jgi:hemoglobin-like flavoprotein
MRSTSEDLTMTPEQIRLVTESVEALRADSDRFARAFYDRLFELDPQARTMFTTDPAIQRQKFFTELDAIVHSINNLDRLFERTKALGAYHRGLGVRAHHYRTVGEALRDAAATLYADEYNPELAEAWRLAYRLVAEAMLQGAASASAS